MPAYRQAEFVAEALDSLLAQTYTDWEVAVVDDGSPDNVADIVRPYAERDPRIRFHHTDNHGVSAARNYGIRHTDGEFIVALDADDKLAPTYLERCVSEFLARPEAKIVYTDWKFFGVTHRTPHPQYTGYKSLLVNNVIYCSAMFRRRDYEAAGGYDENIPFGFEDWDLWIRILDEDSIVIKVPAQLFYYRIKKISRSTGLNTAERLEKTTAYIYSKYRDRYDKFFGNRLSELQRLDALETRLAKWKRRSVFSRLWYALTGRF